MTNETKLRSDFKFTRHDDVIKSEYFLHNMVLCERNPPVTGGFPSQRPVKRSLIIFFDVRLNKRLSKQPRRRWFEPPWRLLWHHCNGHSISHHGVRAMECLCRPFCIRTTFWKQGAVSIRKTVLQGMVIPMLKIRRPNGRLIFNMEIAIRR